MTGLSTNLQPGISSAAIQVKVKRLHPHATMPVFATAGAACFDLTVIDDDMERHPKDEHAVIFRTGLAFEIPPGMAMLIFSRSGHGFNDALRLSNCVGVIDSDYRGEVKISLRFDGTDRSRKIRCFDRAAQAMIVPLPAISLIEADELSGTDRGEGGFGSTGDSHVPFSTIAMYAGMPPAGVTYDIGSGMFRNAAGESLGSDFFNTWRDQCGRFPIYQPPISDREWSAQPADQREGTTINVPGVGSI